MKRATKRMVMDVADEMDEVMNSLFNLLTTKDVDAKVIGNMRSEIRKMIAELDEMA